MAIQSLVTQLWHMQRRTSHELIVVVRCSKWISTRDILGLDAIELGFSLRKPTKSIFQSRSAQDAGFTQPRP